MAKVSEVRPKSGQTHAARRRRFPLGWTISIAVGIAIVWFGWNTFRPKDDGSGQMVLGTVKRGDILETVSATGSIAAQTGAMVKIGSQITGRIKRLYADVGTVVKAGDLIAELDLPDIRAQLDQANANHSAAISRLVQSRQNVTLGQTQTSGGIGQARANLASSQQKLLAAQAASQLQNVQTPADIRRASASVKQAKSTLSTAQSLLVQVLAGVKLQVQSAEESLRQALATDLNNQTNFKRQQSLLDQGFVAQNIVDIARQAAAVSQSQVRTSQQSLLLTKQKVVADQQSAEDQVALASQGIETARAALAAANAETYNTASKVANVADAVAAVAQSEASLRLATGNLVSNQVREQDIQQAISAVDQATAQIKVSQAQVDKTRIRTPISGTVLQLAAQQGETLAAGLSAPTLIIVADLNRLQVNAYIDETDIGKVQLGQAAQISVDSFPDDKMTGKISKIASGSTIQQGVVTYGVTILINRTTRPLKPDMTASVVIQTGKRSNVLTVPAVAVNVGTKGSTINVLTKTGGNATLKAIPVVTGGTDGVNIEIVSGVDEGQSIVLAGTPASKTGATKSAFGGSSGGGGGRGGPPGG